MDQGIDYIIARKAKVVARQHQPWCYKGHLCLCRLLYLTTVPECHPHTRISSSRLLLSKLAVPTLTHPRQFLLIEDSGASYSCHDLAHSRRGTLLDRSGLEPSPPLITAEQWVSYPSTMSLTVGHSIASTRFCYGGG